MVRWKLAHSLLRYFSLRIQVIQSQNIALLQHFYEFHENFRRTAGIVHRTVMVFQRYADRLRNGIQLETVEARQQETRHGDGVRRCKFPLDPLQDAVVLDKAHIERSIVGNHNGSLTELQEFRQHRFDVRRVKNHVVVDAGQVLNPERDRDFRVDEGGKLIDNRSVFHTDGTDLNDFVDNRGKSRRLDIKHNVASVDVLSFAVDNDIFQVVDEISLHAVDDLERSRNFFQLIFCRIRVLCLVFFPVSAVDRLDRMVCLREGLHHAVVSDRDRRMAPLVGTLYQTGSIGDTVHIAHLCMTVQLHTLHRTRILTAGTEIGDLLDAPDRHNRQIVVKCINRRFSFYFNERAFFDRIL